MLIRRRHNNYLNWSFVALALAAVMALAAAIALPAVTEAASPSLTISKTPTGKSVTSGEAKKIGSVKATGINAKRIRYSLQGPDGFSIKKKNGKISYDGSAVSGTEAILIVTASDKRNKVTSTSVSITVAVTQPAPQVTPPPTVAPAPPPEEEGQPQAIEKSGTHPWTGNISCSSKPIYINSHATIVYKRHVKGGVWNGDTYVSGGSSQKVVFHEIETSGSLWRLPNAGELTRWEYVYASDWWHQCKQTKAAREMVQHCIWLKDGNCSARTDIVKAQ